MKGRTGPLALALALALALPGCGGEERPRLVVSAAASLTEPLEACARAFPADVRLSFAGSDALAGQIRLGARADVFAAADTELPAALAAEGRLGPPSVFAGNELVLAVPADSRIRRLEDVTVPGVDVAVGAEGVPVGDYTRAVLARLPAPRRAALLANVRSEEPDVKGIVGKLTQGAVDAGLVYASDARAAGDRLRAVRLPAALRPRVAYAAGVVPGAEDPGLARRFVADLRSGRCGRALRAAGFLAPPTR